MENIEFIKFYSKPRTTDLYALDQNKNVWLRIGPVEWERMPAKGENNTKPERIQKGLNAGELAILLRYGQRRTA
ncbi:MAG TPA: hypothetical protein VF733_01405 [Candidatus Saccharimonadales bacterium]